MRGRFSLTRQAGAGGLLAILLAIPASPAFAALDCNNENLSQADLNQCEGEAYKMADKLLNENFQKILGCLKEKAQPLVDAQRAWVKFRDAECKFQGSAAEGGSIQPMIIGACLKSITQVRARALGYYLTCQEGDASCPTVGCDFKKAGAAK